MQYMYTLTILVILIFTDCMLAFCPPTGQKVKKGERRDMVGREKKRWGGERRAEREEETFDGWKGKYNRSLEQSGAELHIIQSGRGDHGSLVGQHVNRTACLFLHRTFSFRGLQALGAKPGSPWNTFPDIVLFIVGQAVKLGWMCEPVLTLKEWEAKDEKCLWDN